MPYPVLIGRRTGITQKYKVRRLPNLVIIDKNGKIDTSETFLKTDQMKEIIDRLIKE